MAQSRAQHPNAVLTPRQRRRMVEVAPEGYEKNP